MAPKSQKFLKKLDKLLNQDGKEFDKEVDAYMENINDFQNLVNRVDDWYNKNEKRYLRMMSIYKKEEITEMEFKLAFRDLRTSFSALEEHIIYRMIDPGKTGKANFAKLYEGIWRAFANKYVSNINENDLDLKGLRFYLLATFKIATYEPLDMPTTFEALINVDYNGFMLRELIRMKVPNLTTKAIDVFTEPGRYEESLIKNHQRLSEFNFIGGPQCTPTEITLYYEYSMGKIDCPMVNSTAYFGPPNKKANQRYLKASSSM